MTYIFAKTFCIPLPQFKQSLERPSITKVCSINFEPHDNDFCSAFHVYPLSCGAWIISIPFILNRFIWGSNEYSNALTFRVKTFTLSLSTKSQLTEIVQVQRDSKRKIFQDI